MLTLYRFLFVLVIVASTTTHGWLFSSGSSSSGGSTPRSFSHDISTRGGLRRLYNSRVTHAEHWQRPLSGSSSMIGPFRHSGVVVTTQDGSRWLVHKGDGYGRSSQTVVTRANHMSGQWSRVGGHDVQSSRVADYVRAGGRNYNIALDNCHSGRCRMMDLP